MSDDIKKNTTATPADNDAPPNASTEQNQSAQGGPPPEHKQSAQSGPTFTKGSDPLAGVKKGASDAIARMEGKTVSMKVYVGTIIGVVLLMMLARCGG